jgi:uncharacterized coiled-coil protein SlyX
MDLSTILESITSLTRLVQKQGEKIRELETRIVDLTQSSAEKDTIISELNRRVTEKEDVIYRHGKLIHHQNKKLEDIEKKSKIPIDDSYIGLCLELLFIRAPMPHILTDIISYKKDRLLKKLLDLLKNKDPICNLIKLKETSFYPNNSRVRSALSEACYHGHIECIRLLLDHSVNVNHREPNGYTPLHLLCIGWQNKILHNGEHLVDNSEKITKKYETMIEMLKNCGATIDFTNENNRGFNTRFKATVQKTGVYGQRIMRLLQ